MPEEETLFSEVVYNGKAVTIRRDRVRIPSGRQTIREIVEHTDCVAIIPITKNGNILLVNQFRKPVGKELLEIPAGGIDPGEDPESAVRRELCEEVGFFPNKVKRIGGFYSAPGYSTEYLFLYLATDLVANQLHAEDTDSITVIQAPIDQIPNLITSGRIRDAKSIAGLLIFRESQ
jgi:ADP-ribose pyrophosphatase